VRAAGRAYTPPRSVSPSDAAVIQRAISHGVLSGTHWALLFAAGVLLVGALVSFLIPRDPHSAKEAPLEALPLAADPLAVDELLAEAD
jgi:hypothetical protein